MCPIEIDCQSVVYSLLIVELENNQKTHNSTQKTKHLLMSTSLEGRLYPKKRSGGTVDWPFMLCSFNPM